MACCRLERLHLCCLLCRHVGGCREAMHQCGVQGWRQMVAVSHPRGDDLCENRLAMCAHEC